MNMSVPDIYSHLNYRSHEKLTIPLISSIFQSIKRGVSDVNAFHDARKRY